MNWLNCWAESRWLSNFHELACELQIFPIQELQPEKFVQNQSLNREFLLHRALIEAVASKKADAKENLAKAQAMDEK